MENKSVKRPRFFSLTDWQDEEKYLEEQHKAGWKFVKKSACVYTFEKCEPEDVIYQLDFRVDNRDKDEYLQMFSDCGWEYLQDYYGYSYFRKLRGEMHENEEGIFCDSKSRLEMLKNIFRKKLAPLFVIFFFVIIPQAVGQSLQARAYLEEGGASFWMPKLLSIVFIVLFVLYLVIFIKFALGIRKIKKSIGK